MPPRRRPVPLNFDDEGHEESDKNVVNEFGIIFLLRDYAEVSSISGIPQIQRSSNMFRIIFWTFIVLGASGK